MYDFPDALPEERDANYEEVLVFLQHTTKHTEGIDTPEAQAQALRRIEARLFASETSNMSQSLPIAFASRQQSPFQHRRQDMETSSKRSGTKLLPRVATLVAVFCIVLIVGSFFAVEQLVKQGTGSGGFTTGGGVSTNAIIHLIPSGFSQSSVIIKRGGTIQLVNDGTIVHLPYNGYWHWNKLEPQQVYLTEPGMPAIKNHFLHQPQQQLLIGPFMHTGLYHLFDTIHGDATLTIVVTDAQGDVSSTTSSLMDTHFSPAAMTIERGTYLRLVNESSSEHAVYNGYWTNNGHIVPLAEHGLPTITNNHFTIEASAHQEMWLGPFTTTGTFHLYDALHKGMNLIITVR